MTDICTIRSCRRFTDLLVHTTSGDTLGFCQKHGGRLLDSGLELPATRRAIMAAAWKRVQMEDCSAVDPAEVVRAARPPKRKGALVRIKGEGVRVNVNWNYRKRRKPRR